ncbi:MAG: maleylacetate reductase and hydroxyquinol 1,2-dioxygenase domain-containing protein [Actinoplanes sp.]
MESFEHTAQPSRVVFGAGTLSRLRDEVERLGGTRVLLVGRPALVDRAASVLGPSAADRFVEVAMHTPVEVTDRAERVLRESRADCLVSIGGGSSTGLGKALAARTGLPQLAVPTTYAGSEVTPVLGETAAGRKTTRSSPEILPKAVLYDVELTTGLPVDVSVTSGLNAMAHAVEALYSPQATPAVDAFALDAIGRFARALPRIVARPDDLDARADALTGAWLAGICLGTVGMGLHHKLCHVLGGSFGLPHASTHAVVLPHVLAFNAPAFTGADRIARALDVPDAAAGLHDLARRLGAPASLAELGLAETDLAGAASLATAQSYPNPRAVTTEGALAVLTAAWRGDRPAAALGALADQVVTSFADAPDQRLARLLGDLVRRLHAHVVENDVTEAEWRYAIDFLTRTGQLCGPTRQEFILLSDTLGVSSAVDRLTNSRTPDTTPSAVLGPFYVEGPPAVPHGADLAAGLPGEPLHADIRVTDLAGRPVPDAVVDVWQSNQDGFYDVQLPDLAGPVLRARLRTDADGRLWFWSILPSEYPIPDDGPVGELLRATGRHPDRAPHLHFMIMAPGFRRLVTQLFVAGGAYLDSDAVFGVKDELIVDFPVRHGPAPDGRLLDGPWRSVSFTFRIAPTGEPG